MNLREKKHTISGELGMSSMTDIIFILLMFFMMTSALTAPSALNLQLPGKSTKANKMAQNKRLTDVSIEDDGTYRLNGRRASIEEIKSTLESEANSSKGDKVNITISPTAEAPLEKVVAVLDIAVVNGINSILTQEEN